MQNQLGFGDFFWPEEPHELLSKAMLEGQVYRNHTF
jgi:hypothetical protein